MADNIRLQLGMFMRLRTTRPDSSEDPFAPGGVIGEPEESFLNVARSPEVDLIRRTIAAGQQPSQELDVPNSLPLQPAPALSKPGEVPFQKAPPLGIPTVIPFEDAPPAKVPQAIAFQPAPPIPLTHPAAFQPAGPIVLSPPPAGPYLGPLSPPTQPSPAQPSITVSPPPDLPPVSAPSVSPLPDLNRKFLDFPDIRHSPSETLTRIDTAVANFLHEVDDTSDPTKGKHSFLGGSAPGTQGWNPQLFLREVVRLGSSLGGVRLALHGAQQVGLYALNWHGRIWNPSTAIPGPGSEQFNLPALDIMTGGGPNPNDSLPAGFAGHGFYSNNETFVDRHLQLAKGQRQEVLGTSSPPFVGVVVQGGAIGPQNLFNGDPRLIGANSQDRSLVDNPLVGIPGQPLVEAALQQRNIYNPDVKYSENPITSIDKLVTAAIGDRGNTNEPLLIKDPETGLKRVSVSALFTTTPQTLNSAVPIEYRPKPNIAVQRGQAGAEDELKKSFFARGIVPATFKNETRGFIQHRSNKNPKEIIDDNEAYVPLSFTDIRPFGNNILRTVYFRPFITNLSEEFSPEWSVSNGFGRVDPIKTYGGTTRTISLGFVVHAFAPEDLRPIYEKLMWLTSMVYPEYDKDLAYKAGPVVRLRIGDLINTSRPGGLAGAIDSLSIDYAEKLWELRRGEKVPMGYRVAMQLTVLHDVPIGRGVDGKFGGLGTISSTGLYEPPLKQNETGRSGAGADVDDATDVRSFAGDLMNDYEVNNENK